MARPRPTSPTQWRTVPLPKGWSTRTVPRILRRDPQCTLRTHCQGARSVEVDHIGDPADHDDSNLRGVCKRCHAHRTGQQGAAAANARRPTRLRPPPPHPGLTQSDDRGRRGGGYPPGRG